MSDWWSRKLAGEQSTARPQPVYQPAPVRTFQAPSTLQTYRREESLKGVPLSEGERQAVLDPNRAPGEQITMGEALRLWRGGEAHRKEGTQHCPECGSPRVFSRRGAGTTVATERGIAAPAPRCFECGWNGVYSQGLESTWA